MRSLSDLIQRAGLDAEIMGDAEVQVTRLTSDSRDVTPGTLFVAMPGIRADGTHYIPDALRSGAAAILMSTNARTDVVVTVPMVRTADMRAATSALAAAFYSAQPAYNFAVTGTDGKTSTADFVRQLASLHGQKSASIGTLGLRSSSAVLDAKFPAINTSPEPILLHHMLQQLSEAGITVTAIEASSHGLDQKRLDGVNFTAGAFTNLGRDHLDYHETIDAYFAAKARLFDAVLPEGAQAVLNRDDARFEVLAARCKARSIRVTSFGAHAEADYRILDVTPHAEGLDARLKIRGVEYTVSLPLYGTFQLSNMLVAIGLYQASGVPESELVPLLPQLQGVAGRMEKIVTHRGAAVFTDYAHTPAALENILKTLRAHTANKLHVVFGCGGDRDVGKRPEMGAVAAKFADHVIVTDDNPRNEDPAAIRAAILVAAPGAIEVPDRGEAIATAMHALHTGDVLVVAGKGHETTQTIGNQVTQFYDADYIRKVDAR